MMKPIAVLLMVLAPGAALAQAGGEGNGPPPVDHVPVDAGGPSFVPFGVGGAVSPTNGGAGAGAGDAAAVAAAAAAAAAEEAAGIAAAQALEDASRFCAAVPSEFAIDCLAERLQAVARSMPQTGALAESRKVLTDTAARLQAVARNNADRTRPRQTFAAPSLPRPITSTRPLTPVAPAAQDSANEQAAAILAEAETLLLRSSDTQVARPAAPQIERIAAAVGSNKVLLRSA